MTVRLDFLGIGAPKAGTTSLHEYMRTHPQLFLPEAKEQLFFNRDDAYAEGWDAFAAVAFHGAPSERLYGMVTPQYIAGPVVFAAVPAEPANVVMARRIAGLFPDAKLIAMLRDPVERAISSYWQSVVLGDERRGLDEALSEELSPEALAGERMRPREGHQHIVPGEYGRLLEGYVRVFRREQLFVGSTAVLDSAPMELLADLWRFLGVGAGHVPENLGVRFQVRGTGARRTALGRFPRLVKSAPGLRQAWGALPERTRAAARARMRLVAHRRDQRAPDSSEQLDRRPAPDVIERLRRHFAPDLALLERLVGPVPGVTDLPWVR